MIGQTVAHYRIVAAIGAGGMGQVYRATDTKLGRDVALKVLPPETAASADRLERFQREARAIAALNHPHVVTIYSVEESGGVHFITMELVDGEPLDRHIPAGGMPVSRLLDIARGLTDALATAHDKGIIHRDLKPANVMVTKAGRVKVLDFGLARMSAAAGPSTLASDQQTELLTRDGVVMGTMPYMSPEQLHGYGLDHRTDIFSLGVMLYEMASGERPFRGESSFGLASAILRETPRPLTGRRNDLPDALVRIINRCLEKSAGDRFASAGELRAALDGVTGGSSGIASAAPDSSATDTVTRAPSDPTLAPLRTDEGFGVAVMPFKSIGARSDVEALAAGLTEDIVTGLSRVPYLRVRSAGSEAGARYVMEGSVRHAGSKVRVVVQLVDTESSARIWAETYERPFDADAAFDLQDDLVHRIVGTCADRFGVLARSISDTVRGRPPGQLGPYEALMRGFGYHHRLTEAEHAAARDALERAVDLAPNNADCWAMLSWVIAHEHGHGFNVCPGSLDRALAAARRAVDIAPSNPLAQQALAVVSFFRKEIAACLGAAERAIALNPLDTSNEAMFLIAFSGDWDRGCALIRRAMDLNPHHPRWYEMVLGLNEYRRGDYRAAVKEIASANAPEVFWAPLALAAAYAQLGEMDAARNAVQDLLALKADFATTGGELLAKWFDPQSAAHLMDGLRKAGLNLPVETSAAPAAGTPPFAGGPSNVPAPGSGAVRSEEGFWMAVLPFRHSGSSADLAALAEGLSEEIVTGLSRFPYLRVIARSSSERPKSEAADVRTLGTELGARYVMEGSVRQAGSLLRVSVQLIDTTSGTHLWAETYDRPFRPDDLFALQDALVPRIVSTVADQHGVLVHRMADALRHTRPEAFTPYEAVLSVFGFHERMSAGEHGVLRDALERVLRDHPEQGNCWAMLETLYCDEYMFGFNLRPDPLGRALAAAERAVQAAPTSNLACQALAQALFFRRELSAFLPLAERTIALNPMDGATVAFMGVLIACAGEWDRGCAVAAGAMQLNPHFPGWYRLASVFNAYRLGDYRATLDQVRRINIPGYFWTLVMSAAAHGQLGERDAAQKHLRELLAAKPDFAATARTELGGWFEPPLVEHVIDGLGLAGLSTAQPS